MKRSKRNLIAVAASAALVSLALDGAATETEHREHDAHEHGHGVLNVVVEGHELIIEFEIPAVNVVGFEHEPSNDEERHAVETALNAFGRAESLFVPTRAAGCRAEKVEVSLAGMEHEEGEEHGHERHEHEAKAEGEAEAHSELHGEYEFHCDAPQKLESLEVRVFQHLRDVDEIDVQLVTPTMQTALELHAEAASLKLARK